MRCVPLAIPDVLVIEPTVHRDDRGFFLEAYHEERYRAAGIPGPFVQDNQSRSGRGTLRGLHGQRRRPQGKLVRALAGEIWDVAVDVRPGSATFGRWVGVTLTAESFRQCWVPPGFLHGFCVLSDVAEVEYKCTAPYDASDEIGVVWDDPDLGIAWPVTEPRLSARDRALPRFAAFARRLRAGGDG
ncbi:MAG TPA: dTDP-4-dehydrorhamnose 3,5-epimerase [Candidatus Binatia bacterium]|nr:dTDP-4-dehydrorhamnose 3,5-epimerase [Candidatus Binatia bacterium]